MNTNLIDCVLSMLIGAAVVIAWYERNFEKQKAWIIFNFKRDTLYGIKDAVFKVVTEDEDLKNAVFKKYENYAKIKMYLAQDFRDEWHMLVLGDDDH